MSEEFGGRLTMLPTVVLGRYCCSPLQSVENYRMIAGDPLIEEIQSLSRDLKGVRVCQLNSTGYGGGVAELLTRQVPLAHALGIDVEWRLIPGTPDFFRVTKAIHNALQGATYELPNSDRSLYLDANRKSAELLEKEYDVFIVHDPQPAAFRHFVGPTGAKWIWRCHIDSSDPDPGVAAFMKPFIEEYDAVVFTMHDFVLPGMAVKRSAFIPPAIDPLSTKNLDLPLDLCKRVIANAGVALNRPIVLQVSRFDPWKDPMGVVAAYHLAKQEIAELQLVLVGAMAGDDPEGWKMLDLVHEEAVRDPDIHVLTNLGGVGNMEVNAFQRGADVIVQKSLREGFGLVVSEAFWKERPVVAGRAGGIPMQFPAGFDHFLVRTVGECSERILELLNEPDKARRFGSAGREHIRSNYLLPRLLRDELRLIREVLGDRAA
jgi:trehalose synthase